MLAGSRVAIRRMSSSATSRDCEEERCAPGCPGRRRRRLRRGRSVSAGASSLPLLPEGESGGARRWLRGAASAHARPVPQTRARSEPAVGNPHPTVKPIELMRWLVRLACPPGGLVLDPTIGSGTTGAAAVLEGRRFCRDRARAPPISRSRRRASQHHGVEEVLERSRRCRRAPFQGGGGERGRLRTVPFDSIRSRSRRWRGRLAELLARAEPRSRAASSSPPRRSRGGGASAPLGL